MTQDTYARLINLLDERGATYRLIDHPPEGRTEVVSLMRGHPASSAAKCMVLMVKLGKKTTKHVLAVVPGDRRVNLSAVKALLGATYISFASTEIAEQLAGSGAGTILPFAMNPALELFADPALKDAPQLYFNAARLDRSVVLRTEDYITIANPRFERIAEDSREHRDVSNTSPRA